MKKRDIMILCILLGIGIAIYVLVFLFWQDKGVSVKITHEGKTVAQLPLDKDNVYRFEDTDGQFNQIVINNGFVSIDEASCPDKRCVKHQKIQKAGESIICIPNEIVVAIDGEDKE